ncbi:3-methyladenine DNA glycosylase [Nocardioides agariphilus]|uniref:3-methyladenine DNA glycosylase n=1 Tax=Nocardioides agariphilus TaxID=433664 RepID=A0A930VR39_9ACTN|nr:3-methyladenine DNA glycosylase [Nocardioides agariphilus]MBF4770281.1 3-methyladenine DNA glycosylase [Nocardioides agariphilus]
METTTREASHRARLAPYVEPHLARRRDGLKHPVHDFLFTYYSFSPAKLTTWQPGWPDSGTPEQLTRLRPLIRGIRTLLVATMSRPAHTGCFGLHEWAMVHGTDSTRHDWPLRLGGVGTDEVVESHRIACSHFDAYRFFTPTAVGLNTLSPGRDDRAAYEQPGCLHATMDLYGKVAVRLVPMIPSELVADAFELAWDIRILDMRASPYDLSDLGYSPVKIETPEGKREYVDAQRAFMERGAPIRQRLISECERLLAAAEPE